MNSREHWESVYRSKAPDEVSWFQADPRVSLDLVRRAAPLPDAAILDVGGGASMLVDALLAAGYSRVTVLDLSPAALAQSQERLRAAAGSVTWIPGDVLAESLPSGSIDVWHDRALFHFLTRPEERQRYVAKVADAVRPGGHVVIGTFAADGPAKCSGLEVARYSPQELCDEFGRGFVLEASLREEHTTPRGALQAFSWCLFRREPPADVASPRARA